MYICLPPLSAYPQYIYIYMGIIIKYITNAYGKWGICGEEYNNTIILSLYGPVLASNNNHLGKPY